MKISKSIVWHPILVALYPIVALLADNIDQVKVTVALRSLGLSLIVVLLLWILVAMVIRDGYKAGLVCTLTLMLAFSYGHVYSLLKHVEISGAIIGRHRFLAPLWIGLFVGGVWLIIWRLKRLDIISRSLDVIFVIALIFPLIKLTLFGVRVTTGQQAQGTNFRLLEISRIEAPAFEDLPDIYYIILDAYARADTLEEIYGYDNSPFLDRLEEMGFYVADCSQSNYAHTELSLASTLNISYLEDINRDLEIRSTDRSWLWPLMKHSYIRGFLEAQGYATVAFETGIYWTHWDDADIYLRPSISTVQQWSTFGGLNEFEVMLFKSTIGLLIADGVMVLPDIVQPDLDYPNKSHRERVLFILEELERLPKVAGPKFIYAHILSPHFPVVFGPNGEYVPQQPASDEEMLSGYRDQIIYLNSRLEEILDRIISTSDTQPIIILQADHGSKTFYNADLAKHQMRILNAYYLPEHVRGKLYASISSVNSFRIVLNELFGTELNLLEDKSFWSDQQLPYKFEVVPNECTP